jgi:hypothetical protein
MRGLLAAVALLLMPCQGLPTLRNPLVGRWLYKWSGDGARLREYWTFHGDGSCEERLETWVVRDVSGKKSFEAGAPDDAYGRYKYTIKQPRDETSPAELQLEICSDGEACLRDGDGTWVIYEKCALTADTLRCDTHEWKRVSHNP